MNPDHADYSLMLVTDPDMCGDRKFEDVVAAAVRGGVTCVQLREKACTTREFLARACRLKQMLAGRGVALIINDRLDIAQAADADGVHLGQTDMPCTIGRWLMGREKIIGISAECIDDGLQGQKDGADYLSVSPVFGTPTKTDTAPALGLEGLRAMRHAVQLPLVAIGGVNEKTAAQVMQHGADGIAVVSAIMAAANPEKAARTLREIVEKNR